MPAEDHPPAGPAPPPAPLLEEYRAAIDEALQLVYSQAYRLAARLSPTAPPHLTLEQVRRGQLGGDLLHLARVAAGQVTAQRADVLAAIDEVLALLFVPAAGERPVVDRRFWEDQPLGRMLAQAKYRTFERHELVSLGEAAQALRVTRPTIHRWIEEGRLDSIRDPLSGQTFVAVADVEALRHGPPP